jgi:para-nitrobenzyl esterase
LAPSTGVVNATSFSNRCAQASGIDPGYESVITTEDCLSLNVYVPHRVKAHAPVVVWIHGGGFSGGAGQDTNPRKFIEQSDQIVVTINYRLGALGFLNLPQLRAESADGAGNYGLLDQQTALRWVQKNISRFGGDSRNVTIMGQSAGGSSVCDQIASPTAKGLFAHAVIMSGGCSMQSAAAGESQSLKFVQTVGCAAAADVLACLRTKSSADIVAAQLKAGVRPSLGGAAFPTDPAVSVPAGNFNRVPVLLGQVDNERALFTYLGFDFLGTPMTAAQYVAQLQTTYGANASKVLAEYPLSDFNTPGEAWTAVQNDQASLVRQRLYGSFSKFVPTYSYEFAENDTPQFASIYQLQQTSTVAKNYPFKATHVDDLGYLWEYVSMTLPYTDDELELSTQMISYWSQFSRSGNPNSEYTPRWPSYRVSTDGQMSLIACKTSPATGAAPAACSHVTDTFSTEHNLGFWASIS